MQPFIDKVVISSEDPNKISLFIKGFLIMGAPIAMILLGIDETDFNMIVDAFTTLVFNVLTLVSSVMMLWGLIRKVYNKRWSSV